MCARGRVCVCVCVCVCVLVCVATGYFSQISTLADVQENVMRYLHVMSRPKVIDHEHDTVWTEAYMDSTGSIIVSRKRHGSVCVHYVLYVCAWVCVRVRLCVSMCVCPL